MKRRREAVTGAGSRPLGGGPPLRRLGGHEVAGQYRQVEVQNPGEGGHGEERRAGDGPALDLAQRVQRDAGAMGDLGGAARTSGRTQHLAESATPVAIEPMLCEGGDDGHRTLADGWSVATSDGSRAAHFEHTVAITADGPVVLTAP